MGRVINIDELWKELEILYDAKNGEVAWNDALWKIKSAPVVESNAQQWIPCSERLPYADSESGMMLATCGHRDVKDARLRWISELYFIGGMWRYPTGEIYEQKVYAWMPRPKPWKGEQDE